MKLVVYDYSVEMVTALGKCMGVLEKRDKDLYRQIRRSAASVVLNIAEGDKSYAGNRTCRFQTAHGSANETRAALRCALAWNYLTLAQVEPIDKQLDTIGAMLYGLIRKRR